EPGGSTLRGTARRGDGHHGLLLPGDPPLRLADAGDLADDAVFSPLFAPPTTAPAGLLHAEYRLHAVYAVLRRADPGGASRDRAASLARPTTVQGVPTGKLDRCRAALCAVVCGDLAAVQHAPGWHRRDIHHAARDAQRARHPVWRATGGDARSLRA